MQAVLACNVTAPRVCTPVLFIGLSTHLICGSFASGMSLRGDYILLWVSGRTAPTVVALLHPKQLCTCKSLSTSECESKYKYTSWDGCSEWAGRCMLLVTTAPHMWVYTCQGFKGGGPGFPPSRLSSPPEFSLIHVHVIYRTAI